MSTIYSYIDTLLDKWCEWNNVFLTSPLIKPISTVNDALGTSGSDNPSRAKEMFRIGLLKKELTVGRDAWLLLRNNQNIQSDLGFLAAVIHTARKKDPSNTSVNNAFHALCAIFAIIQTEEVGSDVISVNTLVLSLLDVFPCPKGQNVFEWIRYLLSAAICEIEDNNYNVVRKIIQTSTPTKLRILSPDGIRGEFSSSTELSNNINSISLTGILRQKAALFAIGEGKGTLRGFYGIAYQYYSDFLRECATIERSSLTSSPFFPLYIDNNKGMKGDVLQYLSSLNLTPIFNQLFSNIMDTIEQGAKAALRILSNGPTTVIKGNTQQIIYYGAPGTGKSHNIDKMLTDLDVTDDQVKRVTFYPDYCYNDFVGSLQPVDVDGKPTYKFIEGPFTSILKDAIENDTTQYYLIIEEINRGNPAAIFGDIFQLLDRDSTGVSKYSITNTDISKFVYDDEKKRVILPSNLNILCTMNTADQNVFVLDTAFKRRFRMEYVKIDFSKLSSTDPKTAKLCEETTIFSGNEDIINIYNKTDIADVVNTMNPSRNWPSFAQIVNAKIDALNRSGDSISEDKKLGPFFVCEEDLQDRKNFADKVLYYLKQDVFKYSETVLTPSYEELYKSYVEEGNDIFELFAKLK